MFAGMVTLTSVRFAIVALLLTVKFNRKLFSGAVAEVWVKFEIVSALAKEVKNVMAKMPKIMSLKGLFFAVPLDICLPEFLTSLLSKKAVNTFQMGFDWLFNDMTIYSCIRLFL